MNPRFLTVDEVIALHRDAIARDGTHAGILDQHLLESAVHVPQQTFDGKLLHSSLAEMAAAYWFHLVQDHPFVDGNKRAGFLACLTFLVFNEHTLQLDSDEAAKMTLEIAKGNLSKDGTITIVRNRIVKLPAQD